MAYRDGEDADRPQTKPAVEADPRERQGPPAQPSVFQGVPSAPGWELVRN